MSEERLGRISRSQLGFGGYQDAEFGWFVTFEGKGWGVSRFYGTWAPSRIPITEGTEWTEADRDKRFADLVRTIEGTCAKSKRDSVDALVGVPVSVSFDGMVLKEWRVLTEVIG